MEEDIVLEVKKLSVALDSRAILRDICFALKKGEALAVIGPNGAGKTVLFRAILGLLPYEGKVEWRKDVRIGYVPQRFAIDSLVPISVKEFFLLKAPRFWFPRRDFFSNLRHELKLVGLNEEILAKNLNKISGGELQRVLIAWAIIGHPDVLLFDEPTSGIDVGSEETVYTILHRLQKERGTAILLISHDLNVVYKHATQVLCLDKKMVCYGIPREVLNPEELARLYGEGGFYHHI